MTPLTQSERIVYALKHELAAIDYAINVKTEDLARLNERKAKVERQLHIYEGESRD